MNNVVFNVIIKIRCSQKLKYNKKKFPNEWIYQSKGAVGTIS